MYNKKYTQKDLIIQYVMKFGKICPAKLNDKDRAFMDSYWLGSETGKRCRELRAENRLVSHQEGKYEVFSLPVLKRLEKPIVGNEDKVLFDILKKIKLSWENQFLIKEINSALKSNNVYLKQSVIRKYIDK